MRYTTLSGIAALATIVVNGVSAVPAVAGGSGIQVPCDTAALINALATAPAGSTLVLARRCTYHLTTAYSGDDGLPPIDSQLTIEGRDSTIVRDGPTAGTFRIFHVTSTGNLRLDDVTIRGGNAPDDGGGILVDGTLNLNEVTLDNNTAGVEGGGVDVESNATANITRSQFTFNNAGLRGGGLQSNGTVTTDGVEFERNFAVVGGAIDHDSGDAIYRNTTLKNNTSSSEGGGIDIDDGTVQFINSKILNNTTTGSSGGGIWNKASLTLIRTEVAGNVVGGSDGDGGGIYNTASATLVLKDSSVHHNSANGSGNSQGGGIFNTGSTVTLDHSEVNNNASTVAPGGVWTDTQFTVNRSEIRNNIPTNC
ncbi:right-handed parallel beta-helix repeat-containing protein, partial [Streptomyces sp. NPDC047022]|uniref:right-handed parallel beta-helix repeat-containing protein n=1 Tax=Streptomyces sp. NPDC047022 TaxID=3155737 RepID=UPI0033F45938